MSTDEFTPKDFRNRQEQEELKNQVNELEENSSDEMEKKVSELEDQAERFSEPEIEGSKIEESNFIFHCADGKKYRVITKDRDLAIEAFKKAHPEEAQTVTRIDEGSNLKAMTAKDRGCRLMTNADGSFRGYAEFDERIPGGVSVQYSNFYISLEDYLEGVIEF